MRFRRPVPVWMLVALVATRMAPLYAQGNEQALTVVLVRHAERAAEPARDPVLTEAGSSRVRELVKLLSGSNVTAAYSTQFQRTRLTAGPVAQDHDVSLEIVEAARGVDHIADVVERIRSHRRGEVVVVAGHSNTVPAIVSALAGMSLEDLGEFQYDRLYIVSLSDPAGTGSLITLRYGTPTP